MMPGCTLREENLAFWLDLGGRLELWDVITCDTRCMRTCKVLMED